MTKFQDKYRIEFARRPGWDYTIAAWYFVTICTTHRQPFLGEVTNGIMHYPSSARQPTPASSPSPTISRPPA